MSDIKQVGDTGIYTAEGCVAGSVAASLALQRDKEREDYERRRCQIKAENNVAVKDFGSKFSVAKVISETDKFNGLMTAEEWAAARSYELDASKRLMEQAKQEAQALKLRQEAKKVEREKKRKAISSSLSFSEDLEVDNGEENNNSDGDRNEDMETSGSKRRLVSKDPTVDTAFLPDRARDLLLQEQKELLRQEWLLKQERAKEEMVEVTYSYWDGSGHRKSVSLKKGTSIGKFLEAVKQELGPEFKELRNVTSDNLMYIKEDLIISHHYRYGSITSPASLALPQ